MGAVSKDGKNKNLKERQEKIEEKTLFDPHEETAYVIQMIGNRIVAMKKVTILRKILNENEMSCQGLIGGTD